MEQWGILDSAQSEPFCRVVEAAAKLKLFRQLDFPGKWPIQDLNPRLAAAIASVIRERGQLVEKVTIGNFQISVQAMAALATGLATAGQADGLPELHFKYCQFIGRAESGGLMGAPDYLAAGLASNATLKKLGLADVGLNDASLASIVGALSNHPTLEALELWRCEYGRSTIESIHRWLRSDGCRLRKLRMDGDYASDDPSEGNLDLVQLFVHDLPQNASIESLSISDHPNINESHINLLLGSLWKFPNLRSLRVTGNRIADIVTLTENLAGTMPAHRLRCLDLSNKPSKSLWPNALRKTMDEEISFLQLLQVVFPELGYLGLDFEMAIMYGKVPSSVVLRLHRNRCFGLLKHGATIPLSVWPVVMGKVNGDRFLTGIRNPSRGATILYEMLQGPAFVGRGSL